MTFRYALGLVSFIAGVGLAVYGTVLRIRIVQDVNRRLPAGQQFDLLGWHPLKSWRLNRKYRRLCPEGRYLQTFRVTTIGLVGCLLAAAFLWGFFG